MPDKESWQGASRAPALGYRIFIWLLNKAGVRAAYMLLHPVTLYYRLFAPTAIRPLKYLYRKKLGYSIIGARRLIKKNLYIFGQTLIDKIVVLAGKKDAFTFEEEGIDNIKSLKDNGKGGILVSAHLGNWEVAGHLLEHIGATINIVMYDGEAEQIKSTLEHFERKRSFNIILIKEDLSHIYEMTAALNRNELICLHGDRFRPGNRTMPHKFLGEEANFPAGPFILASKLKAPVVFTFAYKETAKHYHFYAFPPKTYEGRGTSGMELMLDDYVKILEGQLKKYPEQWFNYYDFWKA